jgi:HSP20 family molecular chaperone IbpA
VPLATEFSDCAVGGSNYIALNKRRTTMSRDDFGLSVFKLFDDLWNGFPFPVKVPVYTCTNFPPVNVHLRKNKDFEFEFALAGYSPESVDIEFLGDYMTLKVGEMDRSCCNEGDVHLYKGIKSSAIEARYFVPSDKYATSATKAEWKNGLLKVKIPAKEKTEAKKITIYKV